MKMIPAELSLKSSSTTPKTFHLMKQIRRHQTSKPLLGVTVKDFGWYLSRREMNFYGWKHAMRN